MVVWVILKEYGTSVVLGERPGVFLVWHGTGVFSNKYGLYARDYGTGVMGYCMWALLPLHALWTLWFACERWAVWAVWALWARVGCLGRVCKRPWNRDVFLKPSHNC